MSQASPSTYPMEYYGPKKEKKMGWIKKIVRNWLIGDVYNSENTQLQHRQMPYLESRCINFNVFRAKGGFIIETKNYKIETDCANNTLYIITEDLDIGTEIGKILAMECLRN